MIRSTVKWSSWLLVIFLTANIILGFVTNVATNVTDSDESIFRSTLSLSKPEAPLSYEREIAFIKAVQLLILTKAPLGDPIQDYADREPADLLKNRTGLCFDRSRTYDKVFSWLGFKVRHVYILYPEHSETGISLPYW